MTVRKKIDSVIGRGSDRGSEKFDPICIEGREIAEQCVGAIDKEIEILEESQKVQIDENRAYNQGPATSNIQFCYLKGKIW